MSWLKGGISGSRSRPASGARSILLSMTVVSLLMTPCSASADERKAEASKLFMRANELRQQGKPAEALEIYTEALVQYPSFKIHLNIGLTLQDLRRPVEAAEAFLRFLKMGEGVANKEMLEFGAKQLKELEQDLAKLEVKSAIPGATLLVDDRSVGTVPLKRPLYLAPGTHRLVLQKEGATLEQKTVALKAGQTLLFQHTPPPPKESLPAPALATPAQGVEEQGGSVAELQQSSERRRNKSILAYSMLGAGLALAATAGILYGVGYSQQSEALDRYHAYDALGKQAQMDEEWDAVESANGLIFAGYALAGVAAVGLGASIYSFATRPDVAEVKAGVLRLSPSLSPQGVMLSVGGNL